MIHTHYTPKEVLLILHYDISTNFIVSRYTKNAFMFITYRSYNVINVIFWIGSVLCVYIFAAG